MKYSWYQETNKKYAFWIIISLATMLFVSCSFVRLNVEPIAASITELSTCKGVNEDGKPVDISSTFSPDEKQIFVCGYLETLQPMDLIINWYYEDELVFTQNGENIEGYFYSFVQPGKTGTFPEGTYRIEILLSGSIANATQFRVE